MIRQPECATVMEEKEREVIQLQRELMEAHATIGRLQAKLDEGEQEAEASCPAELVLAPPSPSEVRYEVSRLAVNMKDRRN